MTLTNHQMPVPRLDSKCVWFLHTSQLWRVRQSLGCRVKTLTHFAMGQPRELFPSFPV